MYCKLHNTRTYSYLYVLCMAIAYSYMLRLNTLRVLYDSAAMIVQQYDSDILVNERHLHWEGNPIRETITKKELRDYRRPGTGPPKKRNEKVTGTYPTTEYCKSLVYLLLNTNIVLYGMIKDDNIDGMCRASSAMSGLSRKTNKY